LFFANGEDFILNDFDELLFLLHLRNEFKHACKHGGFSFRSLKTTGIGSSRASKVEAARAEELHQLRLLRRVGLFAEIQFMLASRRSKRQHVLMNLFFPETGKREYLKLLSKPDSAKGKPSSLFEIA
jgi:hypothetical protein